MRDAVDRAELVDELGRGGEVVRGLVDGLFAARREHRRDDGVAAGPFGLGERAVRDLADELRLEVELVVLDDEEVAFGEIVEQPARVGPAGEREDGRDRPAGADDRAVFEQRPFRRFERVEPGGDEAVQRRRQLVEAIAVARLLHEGHELLDEERVAAAALEQELDGRVVGLAAEQRAHELGGRVAVERVEMQRELVVPARRGRPSVVEAGTRRGDEHEGLVVQPREHAVAQLERLVARPVQVGQREDEGCARRERFEERDRRPQRVVARPGRVDARTGHAVHQVEQTLDHALGSRARRSAGQTTATRALTGSGRRLVDLAVDRLVVGFAVGPSQHAAQRLGHRDEHVRVAVGNALTREHLGAEIAGGADPELAREAALADARLRPRA